VPSLYHHRGYSFNLDYGRWWLALGGIASIIFGILLIIEPLIGAVVLTLWIGAYAVVFGVLLLVLGFQLNSKREALHVRATLGLRSLVSPGAQA
jgi:hypothetical protein